MRKRWIAALSTALALITLPALAQRTQDVQRGRANDRAAGQLQFEYQFGIEDDERPVGQPSALTSGDRFVVRMRSNQPAYACLFVTNGSGSYSLMRVADGESPCARVTHDWSVLPDEDAIMRLDEREGVERIYLVVSHGPLPEIDDMPASNQVTESWLLQLRDRYAAAARWTRELKAESVNVSYRGTRRDPIVAVEQLTFDHR